MAHMYDPGAFAAGVGVAYHPFLHDALLTFADHFDFIELPLDFYADPARAALLDPGNRQLREMLLVKPCVWRSTSLSLGTVAPGFPDTHIARLRALIGKSGGARVTEVIGFRLAGGVDLGTPHALPHIPKSAALIAQRHEAASRALETPLLLEYSQALPGARPEGLDPATFLDHIVQDSGRLGMRPRFVLNAAGLIAAPAIPAARLAGLVMPPGASWDIAEQLAAQSGLRAIIVRRTRNLHPLDDLRQDLLRAGRILGRATSAPPQPVITDDFAELAEEQARLASGAASQADAVGNWRRQIDNTYKAMQIAIMLGQREAARQPPPRGTP